MSYMKVVLFVIFGVCATGLVGCFPQGLASEERMPPQPRGFDYETSDSVGNNQFRKERVEETGTVEGSHGHKDNQGLHRHVDNVSDAGGPHAQLKANEPGTDSEPGNPPADVKMAPRPEPVVQKSNENKGHSHVVGHDGHVRA